MQRLILNVGGGPRELNLFYPFSIDSKPEDLKEKMDDFDRLLLLGPKPAEVASYLSPDANKPDKELFIMDVSLEKIKELNLNAVSSITLPYPGTKDLKLGLQVSPAKLEEVINETNELTDVKIAVPLLRSNYKDLFQIAERATRLPLEEIIFTLPPFQLKDSMGIKPARITDLVPHLKKSADKAIMAGVKLKIDNIPLCSLVGYRRYLRNYTQDHDFILAEEGIAEVTEVRREGKTKLKQCELCKYYKKCQGVWKGHFKGKKRSSVMPITGKTVLTDNERCMVSILIEEDGISTKRMLELKSSERFQDICAHCVGSDDVMETGNNLQEKGVVDKNFGEEGYRWSLRQDSKLVDKLKQSLSG